jgi:hypothetical protein
MNKKKDINYIQATLKFCVAGLFIPGITVFPIFGFQWLLQNGGVDCKASWVIIWTTYLIGALVTPFIFIWLMYRKLATGYNLTTDKLTYFNLAEYMFIQCTLASLFTTGQTLCYGHPAQNGIEFIFTGWLALPILIGLSYVFEQLRKKRIEQIKVSRV